MALKPRSKMFQGLQMIGLQMIMCILISSFVIAWSIAIVLCLLSARRAGQDLKSEKKG